MRPLAETTHLPLPARCARGGPERKDEDKMNKSEAKRIVREAYGKMAEGGKCCESSCCGTDVGEFAKSIGYSEEELRAAPEGANLGLGCGNPTALASLSEGETVLDLGSGAGFDCFLAAGKVGPSGKVIGVDMTPEMVEKARENARRNGIENVEFRLGEIENLPVADASVDVVISNCVINLSPNKARVFQEIYRALKPGGRAAISDIALLKPLPEAVQKSMEAYVGCVAGAVLVDEYRRTAEASGLREVKMAIQGASDCITSDTSDPLARIMLDTLDTHQSIADYVVRVSLQGRKR